MKPINCSPTELETIISHHEKHGANPARFELSCPVKALKAYRLTAEELEALEDTSAKPIKRANDLGEIVKHSDLSVLVNFRYAGNVNAQRVREGKAADFVAKPNWFFHVSPAVVEHNTSGERYVFVRVLRNLSAPRFTVGGVDAPRADLLGVLPSDELSDSERATYGLEPQAPSSQGVEKEVQPIAVKLANVRSVTIDGFLYVVNAAHNVTVKPDKVTATSVQPNFSVKGESLEDEVANLLKE